MTDVHQGDVAARGKQPADHRSSSAGTSATGTRPRLEVMLHVDEVDLKKGHRRFESRAVEPPPSSGWSGQDLRQTSPWSPTAAGDVGLCFAFQRFRLLVHFAPLSAIGSGSARGVGPNAIPRDDASSRRCREATASSQSSAVPPTGRSRSRRRCTPVSNGFGRYGREVIRSVERPASAGKIRRPALPKRRRAGRERSLTS